MNLATPRFFRSIFSHQQSTISMRSFLCFLTILLCVALCTAKEPKVVEKASEIAGSSNAVELHKVARGWIDEGTNVKEGWELMQYLADERSYVPSLARMGHKMSDDDKKKEALEYFQAAAVNGPHHASLMNAGRLLVEGADAKGTPDYVGSLNFLRSAAMLHETHPKYAQKDLTALSKQSYDYVSEEAAGAALTLEEAIDVFIFGSLTELSEEVIKAWTEAAIALAALEKKGANTVVLLKTATAAIRTIWEPHSATLTTLQAHVLLTQMTLALRKLSDLDAEYVPMFAGYAEALAMSPHCYQKLVKECFQVAISVSLQNYEQVGDTESVNRVTALAMSHPKAGAKKSSDEL